MKIFGNKLSKKQIFDRIGDISQLGAFRSYELNDGPAKGIRAIDIKTPASLDFTTLLDRGLDISYLSYKSIPISWRSATLETHPSYFESRGDEWLRNFYGGLFVTCGLTYNGFPCTDGEEELNIHGRISNLPAYQVSYGGSWEGDRYRLDISGKVREVKFFEGAKLIESEAKVIPFDDDSSKAGFKTFSSFSAPTEGFENQIFYHDIKEDKEGYGNIAIINEGFNQGQGLGLQVRYRKDTLPCLTQWKKLDTGGDYVCGLEPANNFVGSRAEARENGTLNFIEPYGEIDFEVEFTILGSNSEISEAAGRYMK